MNKIKQEIIENIEELKKSIIKGDYKKATLISLDIAIKTKELRDK